MGAVQAEIKKLEQLPMGRIGDEELSHRPWFHPPQPGQVTWAGQAAAPDVMLLGTLRDGRLKVLSPIEVRFTTEADQVVAEAIELAEFGFGGNRSEALDDLQHAITELYFSLKGERDRLGRDLLNVWGTLQVKVKERIPG